MLVPRSSYGSYAYAIPSVSEKYGNSGISLKLDIEDTNWGHKIPDISEILNQRDLPNIMVVFGLFTFAPLTSSNSTMSERLCQAAKCSAVFL